MRLYFYDKHKIYINFMQKYFAQIHYKEYTMSGIKSFYINNSLI